MLEIVPLMLCGPNSKKAPCRQMNSGRIDFSQIQWEEDVATTQSFPRKVEKIEEKVKESEGKLMKVNESE